MDARTLNTFEASLERCQADAGFLDLFYAIFLASSPKVREKFEGTDFVRQKQALRASFEVLLRAARGGEGGPEAHLAGLAESHGARRLAIGAELYDYWLDSLLDSVKVCDPCHTAEVATAWEAVMTFGIRFMCSRYNEPPRG